MAAPPTMTGSRVRLRAPRADDADAMFAEMTSDPEVSRYLMWTPHPDVAETRRVVDEVFNADDDPVWLIEMRETGEFVGTVTCRRSRSHSLELGCCLARRWWNRGIMTEVLSMLVDEAKRDPEVYRIWAACHVDNEASARVLERAGLIKEGRLARYLVFPNLGPEPQDCLMFAKAVR